MFLEGIEKDRGSIEMFLPWCRKKVITVRKRSRIDRNIFATDVKKIPSARNVFTMDEKKILSVRNVRAMDEKKGHHGAKNVAEFEKCSRHGWSGDEVWSVKTEWCLEKDRRIYEKKHTISE